MAPLVGTGRLGLQKMAGWTSVQYLQERPADQLPGNGARPLAALEGSRRL